MMFLSRKKNGEFKNLKSISRNLIFVKIKKNSHGGNVQRKAEYLNNKAHLLEYLYNRVSNERLSAEEHEKKDFLYFLSNRISHCYKDIAQLQTGHSQGQQDPRSQASHWDNQTREHGRFVGELGQYKWNDLSQVTFIF